MRPCRLPRRLFWQASGGGHIQTLTEDLRRRTEAEFIVVGDRDGLRLTHPNSDKIGRAFVGGDIDPALNEGSRYTSEAIGTLGPSLRGIVPVQSVTGDIIGFVAVGYLIEDVRSMIRGQHNSSSRLSLSSSWA